MKKILTLILCAFLAHSAFSKEYFVSQAIGDDKNKGTQKSPFKTIQRAADIAVAGDIITVAEGVYREKIVPKNGGKEGKPIVYQAAKDAKVEIKGSEVIKGWVKQDDNIWKVVIPNEFFGDFNSFKIIMKADWFEARGRDHHPGEVFLNNKALYDKESIEKLTGNAVEQQKHLPDNHLRWTSTSDDKETIIYAVFGDADPNKELVEISVRPSCFCPDKEGINYITIRGFEISQAASEWAPPTQEQIGMIAARWNKGWVIENNIISNTKCNGITLGKYSDYLHLDELPYPNTAKNDYSRYIECVFRAIKYGWNKENIGSHIVRNNKIFNCGQTAICGSMGASWSIIENNEIFNIYRFKEYFGAEMAGIKFHAALDTIIRNNYIHHTNINIWLDWMTQGTQVVNNVLTESGHIDLFVEVSHGPYLVANNIMGSRENVLYNSGGGAYVHNVLAGFTTTTTDQRFTPYFFAHGTQVAGFIPTEFADNRYLNNMFATRNNLNITQNGNYGLSRYSEIKPQIMAKGNIYLNMSRPVKFETGHLIYDGFDSDMKIVEEGKDIFLMITLPDDFKNSETEIVKSEDLGIAYYPEAPFVNPDGSSYKIDKDFLGNPRPAHPAAGALEGLKPGLNKIKVWERK